MIFCWERVERPESERAWESSSGNDVSCARCVGELVLEWYFAFLLLREKKERDRAPTTAFNSQQPTAISTARQHELPREAGCPTKYRPPHHQTQGPGPGSAGALICVHLVVWRTAKSRRERIGNPKRRKARAARRCCSYDTGSHAPPKEKRSGATYLGWRRWASIGNFRVSGVCGVLLLSPPFSGMYNNSEQGQANCWLG